MSKESVEVVRGGYEALRRGDVDGALEHVAEDVELCTLLDGVYRGPEGIRRWLGDLAEGWASWTVEADEFIDAGDRVVVGAFFTGRARATDISARRRFWIVWEVRDGKAARGHHYSSAEEALAAVGLPGHSRAGSGPAPA